MSCTRRLPLATLDLQIISQQGQVEGDDRVEFLGGNYKHTFADVVARRQMMRNCYNSRFIVAMRFSDLSSQRERLARL